ncbi:electron transfer flavoprotein subunit alpha/FixB family protein [Halorubellus sp. PRR65]|uniref:electron transfer flavoprotein subunit alpha/FixB family protein n=1 Tax=Halorubellus sp. PRR65 TaxID=3098148 RepID=UPI002B25C069|nr:electron transfer flavoprotein subunit alpha/FixB family protein [Halorubellus sp. PRR65]
MAVFDPNDFEISELGPKVKDVEDAGDLEEVLEREKEGKNRDAVKTLVQSRIDKLHDEDEDAIDYTELDPGEYTVAEMANLVRDVDDADALRGMLEREEAGDDRSTAKDRIQSRLDQLESSEDGEEAEYVPPEEKYPDLDHPTEDKQYVHGIDDGDYRDMWVYCETQQGELVDVSLEMLGKARQLMDDYNDQYDADERVVAVLMGDDVEGHVDDCIACGADLVVVHEDERMARFQHKAYAEVFCDIVRGDGHEYGREDRPERDWHDYDEPRYVLFPATNNGRDLSAQVQAELDSGLASDCSGLYIEDTVISNPAKTGGQGKREFERVLHMKRPDFSGFEYSTILCLDKPHRDFHPQGGSVIPGSFEIPEADAEREGEVVHSDLDAPDEWFRADVQDFDTLEEGIDLTGYDVVIALGRGIGDDPTKGIELGLELRDAFEDAELGLSRGVITSSYSFDGHVEQYIGEDRQIGESGQVVEPDIYVAAGISGAIQHKVGMDESDTIIAINTEPDADIRDFSDYYVHGDLFEVLPRLTEAVESGELRLDEIAASDD